MEQSAFFRWISRINSMLFLVLLLAAATLAGIQYIQISRWDTEQAVVVGTDSELSRNDIKLSLGNIHRVAGYADVQYIELSSSSQQRGLSSVGYGGGQIRNVVYLVGPELDTHWLYKTHTYLIKDIEQLKAKGYECDSAAQAVALLYKVVKEDSNGDGKLSEKDLVTVSLTKPDGTVYTELGSFDSVIDYETDVEGEYLTLVIQKGDDISAWKYALADFKKLSEKTLTTIE